MTLTPALDPVPPLALVPLLIEPAGAVNITVPFALITLTVILPLLALRLTLPAPTVVMFAL